MKETKVYVDELPKDCFKCLFMTDNQEGYDGCFCKILDERAETKSRLKGCPLIDIKTHDRELVKKVCEKIKQDCWCGGAILEDNYYKVPVKYLQNLQKEFEDENNED